MGDTKDNLDNDLLLDKTDSSAGESESDGLTGESDGENGKESECPFSDQEIEGRIMHDILVMMKGNVSDKFIEDLMEYLEKAYHIKYRHSYHNISLTIYQNLTVSECALSNLTNNMQVLYEKALEKFSEKRDITNGFKKLYDHISLEIIRINDNKTNIEEVKELICRFKEESETGINRFREEYRAVLTEQSQISKKDLEDRTKPIIGEIEGVKNGLINQTMTILGIFSAIVLAFSGGMIYSSSVLENINKSSAYRILLICLAIGFTLINAIIALLLYLGKIIRSGKKNEKENGKFVFKDFLISNIFWIVTDVIFIIAALMVLYGWEHSTEKALLDRSNRYYIEKTDKETEDIIRSVNSSISGNN